MIYRQEHQGGVWIDLENPQDEEIRQIAKEFGISDRIEAELLSPTPTPLIAGDDSSVLLVLHFPRHDDELDGESKNQELDFVVGKHFIITVRYELIQPLHRLQKLLETEGLLPSRTPITTDVLIEILFAHLYSAVREHANRSATRLAAVERAMFAGQEKAAVRTISEISREFLHLEASLTNQEEPLSRLLSTLETRAFFGHTFADRVTRIISERTQVAHLVRTHRAIAAELRETNNALLNAKQNEIIKILTVVSFIFLPLALIAKIFAMKVDSLPFAHDPDGFWIVLGIMGLIAFPLILFVWRKRWL